jgi:YHS domain-containing protein
MIRTLIISTSLLFACAAAAADSPAPVVIHAGTQTHCPVGGGEVVHQVFIDHQGQRIYFCCPGCEGAYQKDPEKHLAKIAAQGQTVASVQTACPISGKAVDPTIGSEHLGRQVFFCSQDCIATFTADPVKYLSELK